MSKKKNNYSPEVLEQNNQQLKAYAEQLNQIQAEITKDDALCIEHGKRTLEKAIKAGGILAAAKDLVPHGGWEDWVAENVSGIGFRTTQNYIKLYYAAKRRDELITSQGPNTQHVSLLDEAKSLREAYRAVGIIKQKLGANKDGDGDGDEREPSPQTVKKENPKLYEETLTKTREATIKLAQDIIKDITKDKKLNWNIADWRISRNGSVMVGGDKSAADCLKVLAHFIAGDPHTKVAEITRPDGIAIRAGAVLSEILKNIIQANRPPTPEAMKPEEFFMEFGDKAKPPVEVADKIAA